MTCVIPHTWFRNLLAMLLLDYAHLSDAALTRYQPIHLQFLVMDVKYARGHWHKVAMLLIAWVWEYAKIRHVALLQSFMMTATYSTS